MEIYLWIAIGAILIACILSFIFSSRWLKVRNYSVSCKKLSEETGDVRITLISDLHEASFGKDNSKLIKKIQETFPDVIVIAGDVADTYGKVGGSYENLFKRLPEIAPTYLVFGNHDYAARRDVELAGVAANTGIMLLDDICSEFRIGKDVINIIGVSDYSRENVVSQTLAQRIDIIPISDFIRRCNILISHRPVELEEIAIRGLDIMLCGHTHGGQMRLPFFGGVFEPSSIRLFPKYDRGHFGIKKMNLIISSGLGASVVPLRFFNRPEVTVIDVHK